MSNENPNDHVPWRDQLKSLDHLTSDTFDKDAAWDRLHSQLNRLRSDKKIAVFWVAAACSSLVLFVALLNKQKPKSPSVVTLVKQPQKTPRNVITTERKYELNNLSNSDARTLASEVTSVVHGGNVKDRRVRGVAVIPKVRPIDAPIIAQKQIETDNTPRKITGDNLVSALNTPTKEKLSVIHINELGEPATIPPDMVRKINRHSFRLANEEIFVSTQVVSQTSGFTIFKTKTSSN